jgi:hypothetical protein
MSGGRALALVAGQAGDRALYQQYFDGKPTEPDSHDRPWRRHRARSFAIGRHSC